MRGKRRNRRKSRSDALRAHLKSLGFTNRLALYLVALLTAGLAGGFLLAKWSIETRYTGGAGVLHGGFYAGRNGAWRSAGARGEKEHGGKHRRGRRGHCICRRQSLRIFRSRRHQREQPANLSKILNKKRTEGWPSVRFICNFVNLRRQGGRDCAAPDSRARR